MVVTARALPLRSQLGAAERARLGEMFAAHYAFVWRSLKRLGVDAASVDDAAQEVFVVATRKIDTIRVGAERSFLFGTAMRIASNARRSARRTPPTAGENAVFDVPDPAPDQVELTERRRLAERLDRTLAAMPMDLRAVFVLFEIEEMTLTEIATCLDIPRGTVASRLRRARKVFFDHTRRMAP